MGRTIAVGDIHGCAVSLKKLLKLISPTKEDTVVFLGDYIDRGPNSKGVIDQIIDLKEKCKVVTICGNHEEMMLGALQGGRSDLQYWTFYGGAATLDSYTKEDVSLANIFPKDHIAFVKSCVDYHETDKFIFLHAGCDPKVPLTEQRWFTQRWIHLPEGLQKDDLRCKHISGKTLIVGHTPQLDCKILDIGCLKCIDTLSFCPEGCLTALDVDTNQIWQAKE